MANPRKPVKRIRKDAANREDRAMNDRAITQRRQLTDDERVELLRRANFQAALPNLPRIPGHHVCWVSTTHPSDTPQYRMQMGYSFISRSDVPEFDYIDSKSAEFPNVISWREMVGMKVPLHLYQAYMEANHHIAPAEQEESIFNDAMQAVERAREAAQRGGRMKNPVYETGDGTDSLGAAREAPNFCNEEMEG